MPEAILPPRLADGQVGVRALARADIPTLVAACQDPEIPRWTNVPSPYLREDAERFLAIVATESASGEGIALAVTDAAGNELIGTVGVSAVPTGCGEVGYWIAAWARGRGAAPRAVRLLRGWAQAELGLAELEILAHRDNDRSRRVAVAAGFTDTGVVRSLPRMPPGRRDGYVRYVARSDVIPAPTRARRPRR